MQKRYRVKGIHHSNAMTKKMLQVYSKIEWDTEIWIAEEATHLTHKNTEQHPRQRSNFRSARVLRTRHLRSRQ